MYLGIGKEIDMEIFIVCGARLGHSLRSFPSLADTHPP
jgi:hypothetical protein